MSLISKWFSTTLAFGTDDQNTPEVDLQDAFEAIEVDIPTIEAAEIQIKGANQSAGTFDLIGYEEPIPSTTGGFRTTIPIGGKYQYIKVYLSAAQTADRVFAVRGISYASGGLVALLGRVKWLATNTVLAAGSAVIGKVRMVTATGDEVTDDTADAVKSLLVDAAGAVIEKAEDAAHSSGDKGIMTLAVRQDIPASMVSADGDYTPLSVDQLGRVRVNTGGADFASMIGMPELRADNDGWAVWEKVARNAKYVLGTDGNRQFRQGPWAAHLNGGPQSSGEDWASIWIPINDMHLTDLDEFMYTYYKFLAGTADVGAAAPNIVICVHDPADHDQRAEISHTASAAGAVTAGWHETIINSATTALFWYGQVTGTPDTCPTEGTNYTWANYQADSIFSTWTVFMIKIDFGFWSGTRSTGDVWVGSCQINNIAVDWTPADLDDLGTRKNFSEPTFGEPTLIARGNGDAVWSRPGLEHLNQKSGSAWMANLYGGVQSAWNDWAAIYIPVNELPLPLLHTARWSYYLTEAEAFGLNMVIWVHDPYDYDIRAEITQKADIATLEKASGWDAHELNQTTNQFYYYGEGIANTSLITGTGPGNLFGLDDFQGDERFNTMVVYRISFEYGWHTGDNEFKDAWVADITLNNEQIALKPDSGGSGRIGHRRYFSTDTSANSTLAPKTPFRLLSIDCEIDTAGTTDESLTITKDSGTADTYDTLLFTQNTKTPAIVSLFVPFENAYFLDSDELDMLWANSQARDFGFTWTYQTVFS